MDFDVDMMFRILGNDRSVDEKTLFSSKKRNIYLSQLLRVDIKRG